jgi:hypothetical protein
MWIQELPLEAPAGERRARAWASALLRGASRALDSLAQRLSLVRAAPTAEPMIEFHADAGAPEGALYVNGQLVGHVLGVTRL